MYIISLLSGHKHLLKYHVSKGLALGIEGIFSEGDNYSNSWVGMEGHLPPPPLRPLKLCIL